LDSADQTILIGNDFSRYKRNDQIKLVDSKLSFTIADHKGYRLMNSMYLTMVVQDKVFDAFRGTERKTIRALLVNNQKDSAALTAELGKLIDVTPYKTFYPQYIADMEARGSLMFIGSFLGLVLLLATGSILYFRQLKL